MKRIPLLADDRSPPLQRVVSILFVPVALILLLPILLFVILAIYLAAMVHGVRYLAFSLVGKTPANDHELPKPHFLERQAPIPLSDDTTESSQAPG
ncbi:MAG: hypothetical protein HYX68_13545 [Planctomycetes bacterium]|jgi:hypothetical protein|nr:hypothetical protein [Planctomycetota bacterium]